MGTERHQVKNYGYAYKFRIGDSWYGNWIKLACPKDVPVVESSERNTLFTHLGLFLERLVGSDTVTIVDFQTFRGVEEDIAQFLKPEVDFITQK